MAPSANPAMALYGVESFATRFFLVEIEGIAADPAGAWEKETLAALDDPYDAIIAQGRHALATRVGPFVFTSTLTALMARTGEVLDDHRELARTADAVPSRTSSRGAAQRPQHDRRRSAAAQAWLIYDRLFRIAARFGAGRDGFLKTTVYLEDMDDFAAVEAIAATVLPARSAGADRAATVRPVDARCARADRRGAVELRLERVSIIWHHLSALIPVIAHISQSIRTAPLPLGFRRAPLDKDQCEWNATF